MGTNGWPLSNRMECLSSETCEFETVDTKRNKPDRFVFGRRGGNALAGRRSPVLRNEAQMGLPFRRHDVRGDEALGRKAGEVKKGTRQWGLFRELSVSGGIPMLERAFRGLRILQREETQCTR
jgi:hypothetical protein